MALARRARQLRQVMVGSALSLCVGCGHLLDLDEPVTERDGGAVGPAVELVLSQSASLEPVPEHALFCNPGGGAGHEATRYYRQFPLRLEGVRGRFDVETIAFHVDRVSGDADAELDVRLHRLDGGLRLEQLTELGHVSLRFPSGTLRQEVEIDLASHDLEVSLVETDTLVVELGLPSGKASDVELRLGMNDAGETRPTYIQADEPGCNAEDIRPASSVLPGERHLILRVLGSHFPAAS